MGRTCRRAGPSPRYCNRTTRKNRTVGAQARTLAPSTSPPRSASQNSRSRTVLSLATIPRRVFREALRHPRSTFTSLCVVRRDGIPFGAPEGAFGTALPLRLCTCEARCPGLLCRQGQAVMPAPCRPRLCDGVPSRLDARVAPHRHDVAAPSSRMAKGQNRFGPSHDCSRAAFAGGARWSARKGAEALEGADRRGAACRGALLHAGRSACRSDGRGFCQSGVVHRRGSFTATLPLVEQSTAVRLVEVAHVMAYWRVIVQKVRRERALGVHVPGIRTAKATKTPGSVFRHDAEWNLRCPGHAASLLLEHRRRSVLDAANRGLSILRLSRRMHALFTCL
jgi:hypothetical protein